jgi:hypothetical protein
MPCFAQAGTVRRVAVTTHWQLVAKHYSPLAQVILMMEPFGFARVGYSLPGLAPDAPDAKFSCVASDAQHFVCWRGESS